MCLYHLSSSIMCFYAFMLLALYSNNQKGRSQTLIYNSHSMWWFILNYHTRLVYTANLTVCLRSKVTKPNLQQSSSQKRRTLLQYSPAIWAVFKARFSPTASHRFQISRPCAFTKLCVFVGSSSTNSNEGMKQQEIDACGVVLNQTFQPEIRELQRDLKKGNLKTMKVLYIKLEGRGGYAGLPWMI